MLTFGNRKIVPASGQTFCLTGQAAGPRNPTKATVTPAVLPPVTCRDSRNALARGASAGASHRSPLASAYSIMSVNCEGAVPASRST
jgi:hypothetical protein